MKHFKITIGLFSILLVMAFVAKHPYHVSVTEIKYKTADSTMGVTCRIFTSEIEESLNLIYPQIKLDLKHPKDSLQLEKELENYVRRKLTITSDKEVLQKLSYLGHEINSDEVWIYFTGECPPAKKWNLNVSFLYEHEDEQNNIVHFEIDGNRKSFKLVRPDKEAKFIFE